MHLPAAWDDSHTSPDRAGLLRPARCGGRRIQLFNPWFDDGLQPAAAFQEASALGCRAGPGEGRAQLPPGFFWMQWPAFQVWFQSVDMWREPPQPKRWHLPGLGGCKAAKGHPPQSDTIWSWTLGMPIERSR